jgi:RimJ/RimL family protein N-acetyltransferase
MIPVLHTPRLTLRRPGPQDAPAAVAFLRSDRARLMMAEPTEAEAQVEFAGLTTLWDQCGFGLFAITRDDTAIGLAGAWQPPDYPEPEIGWNLWNGADEGQGLATEAVIAARDWFFATQGHTTALSYIHPENHASARLAARIGAKPDPSAPCPFPPPVLIYRHHVEVTN